MQKARQHHVVFPRRLSHFPYKNVVYLPIIVYSLILFLISLGDGIVSYYVPVFMDKILNSTFWMGVVMSFSSVVGITCDLLFSHVFHTKKYTFFLWATISCAILFSLALLILPPTVLVLLFGMAVWGMYYEFIHFSDFGFIHEFMDKDQHATSWSILSTLKSTAYFMGPLLAIFFIDKGSYLPFVGSLSFFITGLLGFFVFIKAFKHAKGNRNQLHIPKPSFLEELKVWKVLYKKVWPLHLFVVVLTLVDSAYWTVGTLLSEELRAVSPIGGLLLLAYGLPSLFVGLLAGKAAIPFGKKKIAFACGALCGLILFVNGFVISTPLFIALTFSAAVFSALAWPEILATFEDYVAELEGYGNDMIGLQSTAISLAYIIGPIIAGSIAAFVGNRLTFAVFGGVLAAVSLLMFLVVPKSVRMPKIQL